MMRKASENQKIDGRPPSLLPCRCRAMTWCSCAGADNLGRSSLRLLSELRNEPYELTFGDLPDVNSLFQLVHVNSVSSDVEDGRDRIGQLDRQ